MSGANAVSYEPLVMEFFEGDVWPALTTHAAELDNITVNGKPFTTVVTNAAKFFTKPLPGLTDRLGGTSTTTVDGKPVTVLSPWHLIADAYRAKRARIAAEATGKSNLWPESTSELVDILFRADKVGNAYQFRSPHMKAATRAAMKLVRDRIVEHDQTGDRVQWLSTDLPKKIEDFLGSPLFAAAGDFVETQSQAGAPRLAMDNLLLGVFDPAANAEAYATMRVGAADLIQLSLNDAELVPLGHMIGNLLAPGKTYLATQIALLNRMHQADTGVDADEPRRAAVPAGEPDDRARHPGALHDRRRRRRCRPRPARPAGAVDRGRLRRGVLERRPVLPRGEVRHAALRHHHQGAQPVKRCISLAALIATASLFTPAFAGGMFLSWRGVRDAERGGATVAGAEDADGIWLNPAGIAHVKEKTLAITTMYVNQQIDYARIDSGNNQLDTISNEHPGQPIPALAFVMPLKRFDDKLVIGGGTWTPYAGLHKYSIDGAQRYGSISIAETKIIVHDVRRGLSDQRQAAGRRDGAEHVHRARLARHPVGLPGPDGVRSRGPGVRLRRQGEAGRRVLAIGLARHPVRRAPDGHNRRDGAGPAKDSSTGKLSAKLPSSGFYEGAMLVGDQASVEMTMPGSLHAGVEVRPRPELRLEAALHVELWSIHDNITFSPKDMRIDNVAGVGAYELGPSVIPRNYNNSYAPSIGGEYTTGAVTVGAGYSYETAAAPKGYVSPLTVDAAKHLVGLGGAFRHNKWNVGATLGIAKLADTTVTLAEAKVPQLTPVRGQPEDVMINAGRYQSTYYLAGVRFQIGF